MRSPRSAALAHRVEVLRRGEVDDDLGDAEHGLELVERGRERAVLVRPRNREQRAARREQRETFGRGQAQRSGEVRREPHVDGVALVVEVDVVARRVRRDPDHHDQAEVAFELLEGDVEALPRPRSWSRRCGSRATAPSPAPAAPRTHVRSGLDRPLARSSPSATLAVPMRSDRR